jgi:hypothetical protein
MDKVQKHNLFNTNTPSSESYRNYLCFKTCLLKKASVKVVFLLPFSTIKNCFFLPSSATFWDKIKSQKNSAG